jgi:hypothetical protein
MLVNEHFILVCDPRKLSNKDNLLWPTGPLAAEEHNYHRFHEIYPSKRVWSLGARRWCRSRFRRRYGFICSHMGTAHNSNSSGQWEAEKQRIVRQRPIMQNVTRQANETRSYEYLWSTSAWICGVVHRVEGGNPMALCSCGCECSPVTSLGVSRAPLLHALVW